MTQPTPAKPEQLETIQELEKQLSKTISLLKPDQESEYNTVGYQTDEQGDVMGLGLYDCGVETQHLKLIDTLTALTGLYLSDNEISKIEGLDTLTALTGLYLSDNEISKIEGLDTLTVLNRTLSPQNKTFQCPYWPEVLFFAAICTHKLVLYKIHIM